MCRFGSCYALTLVAAQVIAVSVLQGCSSTDLGPCDSTQAEHLYYIDGIPYYAGQAMVFQSCAGSFCHAAAAENAARIGAPHGLNFDVSPLLASSTPHDVAVLERGIEAVREGADELYALVESGEMPPGAAGKKHRAALAWMQKDASGTLVAAKLPAVTSKAGKKVLRNWLACDAPVVAYTTGAPAQDKDLGDVEDKLETKIDPTFDAIYAALLTSCSSCHNPDAANPYKDAQDLDFTSADAAYAGLVDAEAFAGGDCMGRGKLVVKGDCESSLLYEKLLPVAEQPGDFCGMAMPLGGAPVSQAALDAICTWIDAGAER
jgi:hypothetical protein